MKRIHAFCNYKGNSQILGLHGCGNAGFQIFGNCDNGHIHILNSQCFQDSRFTDICFHRVGYFFGNLFDIFFFVVNGKDITVGLCQRHRQSHSKLSKPDHSKRFIFHFILLFNRS